MITIDCHAKMYSIKLSVDCSYIIEQKNSEINKGNPLNNQTGLAPLRVQSQRRFFEVRVLKHLFPGFFFYHFSSQEATFVFLALMPVHGII